jgi:4-amino-4-deoxy-L-arabinose transferase-like glycosyltransferase
MSARSARWLLLAVFAAVWFCDLGYRHLIRPDEGRYAEIPREMIASGDWLTPRLNGLKYFEKPPLQYWATAAAFDLVGLNEWAARWWPGVTGFLGVLLVWWAGNRLFAPPAGLLGAAVLASSALYVAIGHLLTLDMGLTFFMTLCVVAIALAQRDQADERERRRWMLAAWAAAALAVLSKGLIGIVLPAGAIGLYLLVEGDWRRLGRLQLASGAGLFLAMAAPWFVAVSLANPEFARFFFIHEHFERFLTREHDRYEPLWYFVPVILLGSLPWAASLPSALIRARQRRPAVRFQPARFLLLWCAVVFAFFSASDSKLASYVLPIFPALALLIGCVLASASRRLVLWQAGVAGAAGLVLLGVASQATRLAAPDLPPELASAYAGWLAAGGALLLAGAAAALALALRGRLTGAILAVAFGSLAGAQLAIAGHETLAPAYSAYHVAQKIRNQLRPDTPFYVVETFDHTLLFYLRRTVTMVVNKDELAQSIEWEPGRFIPDLDSFARRWQADREAFAMFNGADLERFLKAHPVPMQVVVRDARRVIVKKP